MHGGLHTHSVFTHSSVYRPDGTLVTVDYVPKYPIKLSALIPAETPPSSGSQAHDIPPAEWASIVEDSGETGLTLDTEEWEMRQDPDASDSETDQLASD
ncbi:hypothetical protein B0H17DRAFT_1209139 [Mycena rosella]|uniref:Uncharacterized protein n=1 Tax=Mycena rosella TaxID=1033263 RepID=A0AAD7G6G0_MYCRO|nr:hypothetical protein B0H17DRAFT_1209139 [Mycena rosella]